MTDDKATGGHDPADDRLRNNRDGDPCRHAGRGRHLGAEEFFSASESEEIKTVGAWVAEPGAGPV